MDRWHIYSTILCSKFDYFRASIKRTRNNLTYAYDLSEMVWDWIRGVLPSVPAFRISWITQKRDTQDMVFFLLNKRKVHTLHAKHQRYVRFRVGICLICSNVKHNKERKIIRPCNLKGGLLFLLVLDQFLILYIYILKFNMKTLNVMPRKHT